jgi:hypothetical protein
VLLQAVAVHVLAAGAGLSARLFLEMDEDVLAW